MAMGSRVVTEQMKVLIEDPQCAIFISAEQLDELTQTLAKPKLRKYLTQNRTKKLFELIWAKAELILVTSAVALCRDPKDDFIINLALDAKANVIISGDNDLLVLNPIGDIRVMSIVEFLGEI